MTDLIVIGAGPAGVLAAVRPPTAEVSGVRPIKNPGARLVNELT